MSHDIRLLDEFTKSENMGKLYNFAREAIEKIYHGQAVFYTIDMDPHGNSTCQMLIQTRKYELNIQVLVIEA